MDVSNLILLLACLLLIWWLTDSMAVDPPEIKYIKGHTFGEFFVAKEWNVTSTAFTHLKVSCADHCRIACWRHKYCKAVAINPIQSGFHCLLMDYGPTEATFVQTADSDYIYWLESLSTVGTFLGNEYDRFLYFVGSHDSTIIEAQEFCRHIPGFRLGMYKSEVSVATLIDIVTRRNLYAFVDLWRTADDKYVWEDNTTVSEEVASIFNTRAYISRTHLDEPAYIMDNTYLESVTLASNGVPLCQANPLDLDW